MGLLDDDDAVSSGQRQQVGYGALGQLGAYLLAAGQKVMPQQRAQILSQIGNIPQTMQDQLSVAARTRLLGQQYHDKKREDEWLKSPQTQAALADLPPELRSLASASVPAAQAALNQHRQYQMQKESGKLAMDREDRRDERESNRLAVYQTKAEADRASADARYQAIIAGQNQRAANTNASREAVAGAKPLKPGEMRDNPDGSKSGLDIFGRPVNIPAPSVPMSGGPRLMPTGLTPQQEPLTRGPLTPVQAAPQTMLNTDDLPASPQGWELHPEKISHLPLAEQTAIHNRVVYNSKPVQVGSKFNDAKNVERLQGDMDYSGGKYDPSQYDRIQSAYKEMGVSGVTGRSTLALDKSYAHLNELAVMMKAVHNQDFTLFNALGNKLGIITGNDKVTNAKAAGLIVANEVAKALGGAGAVADRARQEWEKTFDVNASPRQQLGAIVTTQKLLKGQADAAAYGFERQAGFKYPHYLVSEGNQKRAQTIADEYASNGSPVPNTGGSDYRKQAAEQLERLRREGK